MKACTSISVFVVAAIILTGCAPSVTVTPAGHAKQFEVTISSNEFGYMETEELLDEWHTQARLSCHGGDYRVVTRDIVQRDEPFHEILVTGIIECN